jgi:uncharacterized iron-regulated membrane protein
MFKFFWTTHKWVGIILAIVFLMIAGTGFLLLIKKDYDWIQPPTQRGEEGTLADFITLQEMFASVFAEEHSDFRSMDDIDRVDFRPGKRIFKVRSNHNYSEIQVDAITGEVRSVATRNSDLIESIHDGSFFGDWAHGWVMPIASGAMIFLVFSGLWIWISPIVRRRRIRRARALEAASRPS